MPLTQSKSTNHLPIVCIALVGFLIIGDQAALYAFTDFWNHPAVIKTKLGIAAQEILSIVFLFSFLAFPALILNKIGYRKSAGVLIITSFLLSMSLLIAGWSFYTYFDKFLGLYVLQMAAQDGRQILEFLQKMPSTQNTAVTLSVVTLVLVTGFVACSTAKIARLLRGTLAILTTVLVCAAIPTSLLWNKPYTQTLLKNDYFDRKLNRVQASEFEILTAKSGPFSAFNSNVSSYLLRNTNFEGMDLPEGSLTKRSVRNPTTNSDFIEASKGMPNIVFLLVESLRPDMLEAYGGDKSVMPFTNELTKNSIVFTNMWAQASHSNYADIASLSGQYPLRSVNIHFYPNNPGYPKALPWDVLKPHGYHSGIFSSQNEHWGLMSNYLSSPNLDIYSHVGSDEKNSNQGLSKTNTGLQIDVTEDKFISIDFEGFMYRSTGNNIERLDEITTKKATTWIESLPPDEPFIVYMNYQASHSPFNALPAGFKRKFLLDDHPEAEDVRNGKTVGKSVKYIKKGYQDSLLYVDQNISSLANTIKNRGDLENTIFVIAADTSISINSKLMGNGGTLDWDVLKIPVIISVPNMEGQMKVDRLAGQFDIFPTLLNLIGAKPHPASQGIDILNNYDPERVIYSLAQTPAAHQYSAIYKNWQLIHDYESSDNIIAPLGPEQEEPSQELSSKEKQWLAAKLQNWINTQLTYYSNANLHETYFPPKYVKKSRSGNPLIIASDPEFEQ